jgi:hypothetical protein
MGNYSSFPKNYKMSFKIASLNLSIFKKNEKYIHNAHANNNGIVNGANT